MKLPWQKSEGTTSSEKGSGEGGSTKIKTVETPDREEEASTREKLPKGYTPPKGRPTPKRHEQEIKRGVVRDPNALTPAQARQRNKELKKTLPKDEWKAYKRKQKEKQREARREVQAHIDAGDERYLLDRDKGPVRRYVRDWVDSRFFLNNWIMPTALVILLLTFVVSFTTPFIANLISVISMLFIVVVITEAVVIGVRANNAVKRRFPGTAETGFGLGMYAFSRATQPRSWRSPKARVPKHPRID